MLLNRIVWILLLTLAMLSAGAQKAFISKIFQVPYDSNYISTYTSDYTTRVFGSVKYSMMGYQDNTINQRLAYRPNNKMLLGLGVNHGFLGLNIGINFPGVNEDDDRYGETDYTDLTMRMYTPKFNANIYLQRYKGFYLRNTSSAIQGWEEGDPYYIRPDIRSIVTGIDVSYIFNSHRFSYRAAVLQNEWQKKSAGSLLVGGSIYYQTTIGDSSIVPGNLIYTSFYDGQKFERSSNFSFGPLIGYAYTFVFRRHYFITGSVNGSGNLGVTSFRLSESEEEVNSGTILGVRAEVLVSAGYNSSRWYFGVSYVNLSQSNQAPLPDKSVGFETGMFRMNIVRRFSTSRPIRILNPGAAGLKSK
jgi:hypothetical protein